MYAELATRMEGFLNNTVNVSTLQVQASKMHALLTALMVTRRIRDNDSALNLLTRVVEGLVEGLINIPEHEVHMKLYRDVHLRILSLLQTAFGTVATERAVTKCVFEIREDIRWNVEAIKLLISSHMVNVQQLDILLRDAMDNGNNYMAVTFAMQLMERLLVDDRPSHIVPESEFIGTIEMLARLPQHRHRYPEALTHMIEMLWGNHDSGNFMAERYSTGATPFQHALPQVRVSLGLTHP